MTEMGPVRGALRLLVASFARQASRAGWHGNPLRRGDLSRTRRGCTILALAATRGPASAGHSQSGRFGRSGITSQSTGGHGRRPESGTLVNQLKITLRGVAKPPVWRRVLVPADVTLRDLHEVIQQAMGWNDYHMHVFSTGRQEYGSPDPELEHASDGRSCCRRSSPGLETGSATPMTSETTGGTTSFRRKPGPAAAAARGYPQPSQHPGHRRARPGEQLNLNPLVAPARVLPRHLPDQRRNPRVHRQPADLVWIGPAPADKPLVPAQQRVLR
jgi:hypothetical protein